MGAWLRFALLLEMGWGALAVGWRASSAAQRRLLARWGLGLVIGAGLSQVAYVFVAGWHRLAGPLVVAIGEHPVPLLAGALLLIGVAWSEPRRHISRDTLGLATVFALVVHGLVALPAVIWLYLPGTLSNWPDADGVVSQSTPVSCMAASGAMLLAHAGVQVSEGQMAHWAGTSPVGGTDSAGLCQALNHFGRPAGLHAVMGRLDLDSAASLGRPFVATVNHPGKGLHALYVTAVTADHVAFIDPSGGEARWSRADFARRWFDVSVWLEQR